MNLSRILVPVDFSTCSLRVTEEAAALAAKVGGTIVLLHVSELPAGVTGDARVAPDGAATTAGAYVRADARARLAAFAAVCARAGVPSEVRTAVGSIVPSILAAIDEAACGLAVLGTHGRTGLARVVLGSVAEGVAHRAHVPVMLIRREARPECRRTSCEWCADPGRSEAEVRLDAEADG